MSSITDFLSNLLTAQSGHLSFGQVIAAIAMAYAGGILSSLTPCVYPMIPITVSVVGGAGRAGSSRSWHEVWLRGGAYVAGMALIYSALGVLAGLTGKVFGSFTNTAGWYFGLSLVMTLAALTMMDVIPFDPAVWWNTLRMKLGFKRNTGSLNQEIRSEMTLTGAFVLGASSGFIAAPCTTPVLTSILAYIAKTQSVGLGLALMLAFSLGLGTLLMVIAAFTGALQVLPRSGHWMKLIKTASGILLLFFAEYLMYRAGAMGGI